MRVRGHMIFRDNELVLYLHQNISLDNYSMQILYFVTYIIKFWEKQVALWPQVELLLENAFS